MLMYRKRALINRSLPARTREPLRAGSPHERTIGVVLAISLLAAVLLSIALPVKHAVVLEGVALMPGNRRAVVASVQGSITDLPVEDGTVVSAGDSIARIGSPESERMLARAKARQELLRELSPESMALAATIAEIAELEGESLVISPAEGIVSFGIRQPGDSVQEGDTIAWIRTDSSAETLAFLPVDPEVAVRFEEGMRAVVRHSVQDAEIAVPFSTNPEGVDATVRKVRSLVSMDESWLRRQLLKIAPGQDMQVIEASIGGDGFGDGDPVRVAFLLEDRSLFELALALFESRNVVP